MSTPANVLPFDPRPLVEPVDRAAVRDFSRRLKESGQVAGIGSNVIGIVLIAVFGVFFVFVFGGVAITFAVSFANAAVESGNAFIGLGALLPIVLVGGAIALIVTFFIRSARTTSTRWYRLDRFARANGMSFVPVLANPPLPGMIFSLGGSRRATDLVRGERPRFVEFANYSYETGSGKDRTTHKWGYVAVKLDVPLPNIVLDATSNNGLFGASNLPASFSKQQRLSLEGDFDQHFALYCPEGYERDALYLFTPDIMARFIDNAAALDIEIVDDWMFLYGKRDFSTLDPATWAWLFSVVGALLDKFAQWSRWRDERLAADAAAAPAPSAVLASGSTTAVPAAPGPASALPFAAPAMHLTPPGVAAEGRRLRRRAPWAAFVVMGVFLLFWLLMQAGVFGSFLNGLN